MGALMLGVTALVGLGHPYLGRNVIGVEVQPVAAEVKDLPLVRAETCG